MEKDCQMRGLNREDAMDRIRWKKGRLMTTIGVEWVNVSSVTGSPGLSRTKSIELQNGCVCCVYEREIVQQLFAK